MSRNTESFAVRGVVSLVLVITVSIVAHWMLGSYFAHQEVLACAKNSDTAMCKQVIKEHETKTKSVYYSPAERKECADKERNESDFCDTLVDNMADGRVKS